jgi:SpoVK/Ycf46/Vps4 family AAA+-type ATPase
MLLLISPPGYGKTTLMEYVAERLGLIFMKINGPSIGNQIKSIDPSEANNAAARQELEKLNLSFEMADNVMLYIDDIQHCNSEFLQKFISLADGQRRIDGVYNGESKSYDLRGKRFCVVMAGNPYTESGDKFQIPDMLSNRADVYNLGDTAAQHNKLFELSMIENGLTSNTYLKSLTQFGLDNLYKLVQFIENNEVTLPTLEGNFSNQEVQDCIEILKKIYIIRDVVLKVNAQYIASAAMANEYRTEPEFKLQGSYRDMNKLMSQVMPLMNDQETIEVLLNHYQNESQTLTSQAEANLLKLRELMQILNDEQTQRWNEIKAIFVKNNRLKGFGNNNSMAMILDQLNQFTLGLEGIRDALRQSSAPK